MGTTNRAPPSSMRNFAPPALIQTLLNNRRSQGDAARAFPPRQGRHCRPCTPQGAHRLVERFCPALADDTSPTPYVLSERVKGAVTPNGRFTGAGASGCHDAWYLRAAVADYRGGVKADSAVATPSAEFTPPYAFRRRLKYASKCVSPL